MKHTGICYKCKMKIPKGAEICPYCHTKNPDLAFSSTMEANIFVVGVVLVSAIFLLLLLLLID